MATWLKRYTRRVCNVAKEEEDKDVTESLLGGGSEDDGPKGDVTQRRRDAVENYCSLYKYRVLCSVQVAFLLHVMRLVE
jgi:hypothetical protein